MALFGSYLKGTRYISPGGEILIKSELLGRSQIVSRDIPISFVSITQYRLVQGTDSKWILDADLLQCKSK